MNQEQILRNIADRKAAEAVLELAEDMPESASVRFWETMLVTVVREAPLQPDGPMSYEEAMAFERTVVPIGKHAGEQVGDVPHSYWLYITESSFARQLTRYMRSEHFQRRQETEV